MKEILDPVLDWDVQKEIKMQRTFKITQVILIVSAIYMIGYAWLDIEYKEAHLPEKILLLLFLCAPVIGIILMQFKKKSGWVVCMGYHMFLLIMTACYFIQEILKRRYFSGYSTSNIKNSIILVIGFCCTFLLLQKSIRAYLFISPKKLYISLFTFTTIYILLFLILLT